MKLTEHYLWTVMVLLMISCGEEKLPLKVEVFETAANGNKVKPIALVNSNETSSKIRILPEEKYQTITGFGGLLQRPRLIC